MYWSTYIDKILNDIKINGLKQKIINHQLYKNIKTQKHVNTFMEYHVFQVWDFMILLKSIQFWINPIYSKKTGFYPWISRIPWNYSKLITEICLEEENDEELSDLSHFDYYIKAMNQANCNTYNIEQSVFQVRNYDISLEDILFPALEVRKHFLYMYKLWDIFKNPESLVYRPLASFCICREGFIPDFFKPIVENISERSRVDYTFFINYLDRHIQLDGEEHGHKSLELLWYFINSENYDEIVEIIIDSLELRLWVLDAINNKILQK